MPRRTPRRRRNHQITVSLTPAEYDLVAQAAFREREPVGAWLRGLAVRVASDGKLAGRPPRRLSGRAVK